MSLHDVYMAQQAIEKNIDWLLKCLESLDLTEEDDAELDRITTALCARSSELEDWINAALIPPASRPSHDRREIEQWTTSPSAS